jgi:DNA polymerase zeta
MASQPPGAGRGSGPGTVGIAVGTPDDAGLLEVKIVSLDYYRKSGGAATLLAGSEAARPRLPIIRVYGVTKDTGQKVAVHVHNVLPYFFVPLPEVRGSMSFLDAVPREEGRCLEEHFGLVFWKALDGALELHHSLVIGQDDGGHGRGDGRGGDSHARQPWRPRVAGVQLVKGVPFYGYHRHEALWLKVSTYDPADVKRAARLVGSGAVLGMKFQPHESHVPYLLQFKIDHNLYGMDWLKLSGGCYRGGTFPAGRIGGVEEGDKGCLLPRGFTREEAVKKQTTCALELDVCTSDIVNTAEKRHGIDITAAPMEEQIVDSLVPMWAAERVRQGRIDVAPTPPNIGERHVQQIDSKTVAYWREKFREAEVNRVEADGCFGGEGTSVAFAAAVNDTFGSQSLSQRQSEGQSQSQRQSQSIAYGVPSQPLSADLSTLVDIEAVRSTQRTGPVGLFKTLHGATYSASPLASPLSNRDLEANDAMGEWAECQRELGYMCRDGDNDNGDNDDRLMDIAEVIRSEEAAGTQRPCSQKEDVPCRFLLEQRVLHALHDGVVSAHNECHDIMEASQIFDAEMKMMAMETDDGIKQQRGASPEPVPGLVAGKREDPGNLGQPRSDNERKKKKISSVFSSENEREQVREAARRLSEIRELFSGKPRRERQTVNVGATHPATRIPRASPREVSEEFHPNAGKGRPKAMTSQEVMAFWAEPASQVLFEVDEDAGEINENDEDGEDGDTCSIGSDDEVVIEPRRIPPPRRQVAAMPVVHMGPHFSNAGDLVKRTQVFGGKTHHLKTSALSNLARFGADDDLVAKKLDYLDAGDIGRALQVQLGPEKERVTRRGMNDALLLELPRHPPTRNDVDVWMAMIREAHANMRKARTATVVQQGLAAMLDGNSGKFLPEAPASVSQTSLVATPLLPSWDGDIGDQGDDAVQAGRVLSHPAVPTWPPSNPSSPPIGPMPPNPAAGLPPPPSSSQNPVQPASPKYDEIDALYKDVLDGADVSESVIHRSSRAHARQSFSQISWGGSYLTEVTPESQMGLNPSKRAPTKGEGLTVLCVEVHAESRQGLLPDPARDAVCAAVLTVHHDCDMIVSGQYYTRIIMIKQRERVWPNFEGMQDVEFDFVTSERELFARFREFVFTLDPDVLVGFEIQKSSLGYLADRARSAFQNASFLSDISRVPLERVELVELGENDQYGWDHDSGIRVAGRIVLNMWRTIRAEVKLPSYSFENCVSSILKTRVPHIKRPALHDLFKRHETRWRCLSHYVLCNRLCLLMIEHLDFIGRTAELARTFGIDFFSVISRGSQYRVESMMLRLAHSQNYIALSPNNEQVARQPAMEALPLVMEPESGMYEDPVCVLDFQSLYPSMIIAYNLCFSTCIGRPGHLFCEGTHGSNGADERGKDAGPGASSGKRVVALDADEDTDSTKKSEMSGRKALGAKPESKPRRLGCRESFVLDASLSASRIDPSSPADLIVTPNGLGFVPPAVRRGVLPRLLHEILQTRIMIKSAMRNAPGNAKSLTRSLNAKQFALKLIANVTYGYTAAGFSGRMPMAELADAIVQSGRETLEDTIRYIQNHPNWGADVIYGDTDSVFVRLKGKSVREAHRIGLEMAKAVTARNPDPVLLKLEKVYRPCFLLSKKRYVGAMYESPDQTRFRFDAKGIETVRRDSCPAVSKIVEQSLRILFTSADVSAVKSYVERQWKRIISGRVSIMDFIFAKEVRLGTYAAERALGGALASSSIPPAALVATKAMDRDPRAEPRYGERISYVVVHGEPGARLIDMVVDPETLVESGGTLRLHAVYYITKQIIPALERFMRLIGVNVQTWYARIPKAQRFLPHKRPLSTLGGVLTRPINRPTIDHFYLSRHCICCDALTMVNEPLCRACQDDKQLVAFALPHRLNRIQRQLIHISRMCSSCGGVGARGEVICESLDCSLYFERRKVWWEKQTLQALVSRCLDEDNDDHDDRRDDGLGHAGLPGVSRTSVRDTRPRYDQL